MNGLYLDIDDNDAPYLEIIDKDRTPFEAMCEHMLDAYEEMGSEKFRQLMARQLALLGPAGSIADLLRGLTEQGVPAMRNVPGYSQKQELIDVDEYALATLIGRVVAEEAGKQTRAALCQALGRLD